VRLSGSSRLANGEPVAQISIEGLSVRLPAESRPVVHGLNLVVSPGEVVGILGRSGCGKSTVLHALAGLVPWHRPAEVEGRMRLGGESIGDLDPAQRATLMATCLDRPDAQLFLATAGHELQAARRLYGSTERAEVIVRRLGVEELEGRRITEMSSGERQRVALAVALTAFPRPILLDEPTAHLDLVRCDALERVLTDVRDDGGSVIFAEQAGWRLRNAVTRWCRISGGRAVECSGPGRLELPRPGPTVSSRIMLQARDLVISRGGRVLLQGVRLDLREGEVVVLTGANGSGKTSLARVLAGLDRPAGGSVDRGHSKVAMLMPTPELQLTGSTVAGELEGAGLVPGELARVLRRHELETLAARAPWSLSRGERQRLVHAALDVMRPDVLVIDEPGQGLDGESLTHLVELIHRRAARGRAYLMITHRHELASGAHRRLEIRDGAVHEVVR